MKIFPVTGIILAGGKSSRMGRDKGLLRWRGRPLVAHALDLLRPLCDHLILSANDPAYEAFGVPVVPDRWHDRGPLGGLATGLRHSSTTHNLIIPCDTPLLNRELLHHILARSTGYRAVVPVHEDGKVEPLCGYYSKETLPAIEEQLRQGDNRITRLLEKIPTLYLKMDASLPFYHDDLFLNINTPADLEKITGRS